MAFLLLLWSFIPLHHAVYVSVTEIRYTGQGGYELSCRLFNNDLEDAIFNQSGKRVSLRTDAEVEEHAQLISLYVNAHLKIGFPNGPPGELHWRGGTAESGSVWASFACGAGEIVTIENSLLVELFPTQQNVVTLERNGEKHYLRFSAGQTSQPVE